MTNNELTALADALDRIREGYFELNDPRKVNPPAASKMRYAANALRLAAERIKELEAKVDDLQADLTTAEELAGDAWR